MIQNHFRARVPNFIDHGMFQESYFEPKPFNTVEELLKLDHVKLYQSSENFSHFEKSDGLLMAIFDDPERIFAAVGWIENPDLVDLPESRYGI